MMIKMYTMMAMVTNFDHNDANDDQKSHHNERNVNYEDQNINRDVQNDGQNLNHDDFLSATPFLSMAFE